MKYGIDEYSRYVQKDGERYCVEPWPFWRLNNLLWDTLAHVEARWHVVCWHVGIMRQHGLREWNRLRKF